MGKCTHLGDCLRNVPIDCGINIDFGYHKTYSDILSGFDVRGLIVDICKLDEQMEIQNRGMPYLPLYPPPSQPNRQMRSENWTGG